jgi:hypothetical protein
MTFRVEGLEALVWFATMHLVVTAAFATHIVGAVLRQRARERVYRQRLASWTAAVNARA